MKPKVARKIGPFEAVREAFRSFADGSVGWDDRSAAILAAATAEAVLQTVLMSRFARDDNLVDDAFATSFRGLGARIDVAYCIGIIDRELAIDLRHLARIRNVFAHDVTISGLGDKAIRNKLSAISIGDTEENPLDLRESFIAFVEGVFSRLLRVSLTVWWQTGSIPSLELPSDEEWQRVLSTVLSDIEEIEPSDADTLFWYNVRTVDDVLSAKHESIARILGDETGRLSMLVSQWVVSELFLRSK